MMTEPPRGRHRKAIFSFINGIAFTCPLQGYCLPRSPQLPKPVSVKQRISSPISSIPNATSDFDVRFGINIFRYRGFSVKEE
jgi:hypothetical protein